MSIDYQDYIFSQSNYTIKNYSKLLYSTLIDLFGDYFTYNELVKYNQNKSYSLDVAIKIYDDNNGIITIWIDGGYAKDINFKNYGSELIYKLEQLEQLEESNQTEIFNKEFYYTEGRITYYFFKINLINKV